MATGALIEIIVPIFALIGIGWLSMTLRLLPADTGEALSAYVFSIAVPVLLFRALGTLAIPQIDVLAFWGAYFTGAAIAWIAGTLAVRVLFRRDARAGVIGGVSCAFSNLVFLGVPVFERAYGEEGLVLGLVLVSVHLPIMMTAAIVLIDFAERRDGVVRTPPSPVAVLKRVAATLVRNPLVIGILAGFAFRTSGLALPPIAADVIDKIAGTAIPVALVALGMGLHRYGIGGTLAPALVLSALKLLAFPAVVLFLATAVFDLPPLVTAIATLGAAAPTGVNAYLIAARFGTGHALSSNTITITAAASILTTTFWLWVLGA